jgi:glycosyltransferase involved in cell wall biosynthesis
MPGTTTSIAAVIPVYNQATYVTEAVSSALEQARPPQEIIVVDDGSTDETPDRLAAFGGRIQVIRQTNAGVAAARNRGARAARSELLAFLDADDAWLPQKLERQIDRLAGTEVGLVHCGVEEVDEGGRPLRTRCDGQEGKVADELLNFERPVILGGGSAALVPRQVFDASGGFDERLSTSADWDLYYRIARRWEVAFVPEVLVRYRYHSGGMHHNVAAMERDMFAVYARAFEERGPTPAAFRRRCYSNLHAVLAGSYFASESYGPALRHGLHSVMLRPRHVLRAVGYPLRALRRNRGT